MRKLFPVFMLFLPISVFANVDVSGCEVIGYMKSGVTKCTTMEFCEIEFEATKDQELFDSCVQRIKTTEECAKYIAEKDELARQEQSIYKCPMTDALLKLKMQENRDVGGLQKKAFYNDNTPIDVDSMIVDTEYAYLFRQTGIGGGIGAMVAKGSGGYSYYIIGPEDKDGMMFTFINK